MEEVLEFSFIYSKDAVKVRSFLGNVPRNIECINYMDIYNKLTKNDYLQTEPSDVVISSYLMRQLQTAIGRNTTHSVYYVLGDLSKDTIEGIQSYIETLTDKEIYYKIYHTSDVNINGTAKLFAEAVEFEVDY